MTTFKVLKNFSYNKYSDLELSVKASSIYNKMTNNTHFPEPNPGLSMLQTVNNNYIAALNKAITGTKEDIVIKNQMRTALINILQPLADYVQQASGGDQAIILSSGYDASKKPSFIGPLAKATGLTVKVGNNKGSIVVECKIVDRARFYEFEYTEAPSMYGSIWSKLVTTKHKLLIEGLTSGKQYAFRVAGAGADPSRNWSDEISSYVL